MAKREESRGRRAAKQFTSESEGDAVTVQDAIEEWLQTHDTSPLTGETLESKALFPNVVLRRQILEFVEQQRAAVT